MKAETAKPNGEARAPTRTEMALHSVRAQLHAIRAQVDGALAALALLGGDEVAVTMVDRAVLARHIPRPRTEEEANFFGKLKEKQTEQSAGAESDA